jgi:hypothetical protein
VTDLTYLTNVTHLTGSLKRSRVGQPEAQVLLTALRDSNLPKFLSDDAILFQAILSDLFPGVTLPEHDYGAMQVRLHSTHSTLRELECAPPDSSSPV